MVTAAGARETSPDGRIEAHDAAVAYTSGKITVSMQIDATRAALRRTEAIVLTPVIRSGTGERELAPVVVSGRNRMKAARRAAYFNRPLPYDAAAALSPAMIPYAAETVYEPWMAGASLVLREDVYGCAMAHTPGGSVVLTTLRPAEPVKPTDAPAVTYIVPVAEAEKNRKMSGSAFLDFPAGKSAIIAAFRNNAEELDKIRATIGRLHGDMDVTIDSIALRGYASPEGSYAANKRIAQQRAESLRDYLQKGYPYPAAIFSVSSAAEDWNGLERLIERSDIAHRDAILAVIRSDADPDVKERKIKSTGAYPELLSKYFPQLRRVEYRLDYTVRAFSVEEGKERILINPGLMSLNEMFLVANAYPKESDEFRHVFDVAVRLFPSDTVANLNEAAVLLERGDASAARRYLEPYVSYPGAWNNLGVMYMLDGDYARARTFFDKASTTPESARNLGLLRRMEEYRKARAAWDAYQE